MKNIIIVTNSFGICSYYINKFKQADSWIPEIEGAPATPSPEDFSRWIQVEDHVAKEVVMRIHYDVSYNIIRVPYEGFAWTVSMNRNYFPDFENIVIATSELYPTPIYANRKAQLMIQGKYVPTIEDIEKWFDEYSGGNILLEPLYDDIYEKFCNGEIPHTSPLYKFACKA